MSTLTSAMIACRCSDGDDRMLTLTPAMVAAQFKFIEPRVADAEETDAKKDKKDEMFPYGPRMPSTNIPVSHTGPVQR